MSPLCQADILVLVYSQFMTPVDIVKLHDKLKNSGFASKPSMAIAGNSNKTLELALLASKAGFKVVGVSDGSCSLIDISGNGGLDINKLITTRKDKKEFKDIYMDNVLKTNTDFLPKIEVDVLLVEFLEEGMAEEVRAKMVLQYNKSKLSRKISKVLQTKQISILRFSAV